MARNYYVILGVAANASNDEIKSAFRRRALELHPDRSGQESEPFLEVQEAYAVLGNPDRRRHYDLQTGARAPRRGAAAARFRRGAEGEPLRPVERAGGFRDISLTDSFESYQPSFEELFDRFWRNFDAERQPKSEHLESLTVEVLVHPAQARLGGRVRIAVPARATCSVCGGRGWVGRYECWQCEGHGALTTEYPLEVAYPAGLRDSEAVRISLTRFGIENFFLTVLFRVG